MNVGTREARDDDDLLRSLLQGLSRQKKMTKGHSGPFSLTDVESVPVLPVMDYYMRLAEKAKARMIKEDPFHYLIAEIIRVRDKQGELEPTVKRVSTGVTGALNEMLAGLSDLVAYFAVDLPSVLRNSQAYNTLALVARDDFCREHNLPLKEEDRRRPRTPKKKLFLDLAHAHAEGVRWCDASMYTEHFAWVRGGLDFNNLSALDGKVVQTIWNIHRWVM